jgi:DNA-binding NarL/FixJ family response regulator
VSLGCTRSTLTPVDALAEVAVLSSRTDTVRVLLADAQALVREAVRLVLDSEPDFVVMADVTNGMQAIRAAERTRPHVAIVDANLPNPDGIHVTREIRKLVPDCRVLLLSDDDDLGTLADAIEAGASAFLTRGAPLTELIDAVRAVHGGETFVPPRMLGPLLARLMGRSKAQDAAMRQVARLTRREREVLVLLALGGDNDRIAQELVISPATARTHIQHVLGKLGLHSRLAAAAFVVSNGILPELAPVDA